MKRDEGTRRRRSPSPRRTCARLGGTGKDWDAMVNIGEDGAAEVLLDRRTGLTIRCVKERRKAKEGSHGRCLGPRSWPACLISSGKGLSRLKRGKLLRPIEGRLHELPALALDFDLRSTFRPLAPTTPSLSLWTWNVPHFHTLFALAGRKRRDQGRSTALPPLVLSRQHPRVLALPLASLARASVRELLDNELSTLPGPVEC